MPNTPSLPPFDLISANQFDLYPELKEYLDDDGLLIIKPKLILSDRELEYGHHLFLYDSRLESTIMNVACTHKGNSPIFRIRSTY